MRHKCLILEQYAGQNCNVEIHVRENGSKYVHFCPSKGYGDPYLEEHELAELLSMMKAL